MKRNELNLYKDVQYSNVDVCGYQVLSYSVLNMTAVIDTEKSPKVAGAKTPYPYLFSWSTTNGTRPTILLELLGANYYLHKIELQKKIQKQDWYLKNNANGKIPTLAWVEKDGSITYVNESAAILLFLANKLDKEHKFSYAIGTKEYYEELEWLFFSLSGLCPSKSNWKYFTNLPEKNNSAIKKYQDELLRTLAVINTRLEKNGTGYLVGDHIGLADIALYPWVRAPQLPGLEKQIAALPSLHKWIQRLDENPAVQRGYEVFNQ